MTDRHTIDTTVGPLAVRVVGNGPTAVLWPSLFMDGRQFGLRAAGVPAGDGWLAHHAFSSDSRYTV